MRPILLLVCLVGCGGILAAGEGRGTGNFAVYPVSTELQKLLLATGGDADDLRVCVIVNATAAVTDDGKLDGKALDFTALREVLQPYADRQRGIAVFRLQCTVSENREPYELLGWAVGGFAPFAGFKSGRPVWTYHGSRFDWEQTIERINTEVGGRADESEDSLGNDDVRVFPVRSALSAFLTDGASCIVEIRPVFDEGSDGTLAPEVRQAVLKYVAEAPARRTGKLNFRVVSRGKGREAVREFEENESRALAKELKFEQATVSQSFR